MGTQNFRFGYYLAFLSTCIFFLSAWALFGPAQVETDLPRRQLGQHTPTHALTANETHNYYVHLTAPHYFRVQIYRGGSPTLYGPEGKILDRADMHKDPQSVKSLLCSRCEAGVYRIEVRSGQAAGADEYTIELGLVLPDTEANQHLIEADRNEMEGWRLHETETETAYRAALGKLRTAATLWQELGEPQHAFYCLMYLGEVHFNLSEYQAALDAYKQAATIADDACREVVGRCENLPGLRVLGPQKRSIEPGWTYNNIGKIYLRLGETALASTAYARSLAYARAYQNFDKANRRASAFVLVNLGELALLHGEKQKALAYLNEGLADWRRADAGKPNRHGEARALLGLGDYHHSLGEDDKALEYFQQALENWRGTSEYTWQVKPLVRKGQLYRRSKEWNDARKYLSDAVRVAQLAGNRDDETTARVNLGFISYEQGKLDEAATELTEAWRLAQEIGSRANQAFALTGLGLTAQAQGQTFAALTHYNQALALRRAIFDREGEAETLYHQARALAAVGRWGEAQQAIANAVLIIEDVRAGVVAADLRAAYLATVHDYYELQIDLLMRGHIRSPAAGYAGQALVAYEQSRARSLRETLALAGTDLRAGVAPSLLTHEREAAERLRAKAEYFSRQPAPTVAAQQEFNAVRQEYRQARQALEAAHPRSAALLTTTPKFTEGNIKALLDKDTLLLEYALGRERSYLWVVTNDKIHAFTLPPRDQIETLARQFYLAVSAPQTPPDKSSGHDGRALSQMLLGPAVPLLGRKRLLIVGEGMLQYLPWAALPVPSDTATPLVVQHEIVNLPSSLTLAALRRETARRPITAPFTAAIFADPVFNADDERLAKRSAAQTFLTPPAPRTLNDLRATTRDGWPRLPFTANEAETLRRLLPMRQSQIVVGFAANYEAVTNPALSRYRIIHFATHGFADTQQPELSGLVLSLVDEQGQPRNGFLWAYEIYNLNLPTDLVVLSACETALGKEVRGEGLMSLTRGFMYAGATRVVASLWKINDSRTSDLMADFYRNLLQSQMSPAAALRAAQITAWRKGRAPRLWAAFTIQGEYH